MSQIQITVSVEQAQAIAKALDVYSRLTNINQLSQLMGYGGFDSHLGIDNQLMGRRAYEVSRVLDKAIAEHCNPNPSFRGVDYDGLRVRYTQDAMPVIEII